MFRSRPAPILLALMAPAVAACVGDRERPGSDLLGPDATTSQAYAEIVHPRENQTYLRTTFSQPPGVQITFSGQYPRGHHLLVLAFSDLEPVTPFFAARSEVEGANSPRNAWILTDAIQMLGVSEVEILLRVLDERDRSISTDSVGVRIQ